MHKPQTLAKIFALGLSALFLAACRGELDITGDWQLDHQATAAYAVRLQKPDASESDIAAAAEMLKLQIPTMRWHIEKESMTLDLDSGIPLIPCGYSVTQATADSVTIHTEKNADLTFRRNDDGDLVIEQANGTLVLSPL